MGSSPASHLDSYRNTAFIGHTGNQHPTCFIDSQCTAGTFVYSANCLRLLFDDNIIPLIVFVRSLFFDFLSIINYVSLTSFVSSGKKSN